MIENVRGEGVVVLMGITEVQAQYIALQRARADAVEKAAGIRVLGAKMVRDGFLAGQFLKTFSHGYVVAEEQRWFPIESLGEDEKSPPVPLYRMEITARVVVPEKKIAPGFFFRSAKLDRTIYFTGDHATITAAISKSAQIAVFNIMADDRVKMLYPTRMLDRKDTVGPNDVFVFPPPGSAVLEMTPLKGHSRDTEAFMIVAVPVRKGIEFSFDDFFSENKTYSTPDFFSRYSRFAEDVIEEILPYEVRAKPME